MNGTVAERIRKRLDEAIDPQTFARNIKRLRNGRRLTQGQECELLGCSVRTLREWENGNVPKSILLLMRISVMYGVSTDELLGLRGE